MSLPPNFGRAVDLSSLGKPKPEAAGPMPGVEITPENLTNEFLALSKAKAVVLVCWSPRSPESQEVVAILGKLALADQGAWELGRVDVDAQPQVAQALQTKTVPYAVAFGTRNRFDSLSIMNGPIQDARTEVWTFTPSAFGGFLVQQDYLRNARGEIIRRYWVRQSRLNPHEFPRVARVLVLPRSVTGCF